jgi:hypothetical protein
MGRMVGSGILVRVAATFRQNGLFLANVHDSADENIQPEYRIKWVTT